MNKRDYKNLIEWVSENKRVMEVTGAFNLILTVDNRIIQDLYGHAGQGIAHYGNMSRIGGYGGRSIRIMDIEVQPQSTPTGTSTNALEAVTLRAQGMNLVRGDITPIMKAATCWPIRKNAEAFRECMGKVRAWCERKESSWFQRADVIRLGGCSNHMASEALEYMKAAGDIQNNGRWWYFVRWFKGTPRNGVSKFQMGVDLASRGMVSMQSIAASLGIDYEEELKALRQEQKFQKLYQQTPTIPRSR